MLIEVLLKTIDGQTNFTLDWKKVGRTMSTQIKLEDLLETEEFFNILQEEQVELWKWQPNQIPYEMNELLTRLQSFFKSLLRIVFSFFDECKIEPPIKLEEPPLLIFRIKEISKNYQIFELIAAIMEEKLNEFFKVFVVEITYSMLPDQKIVDFKFQIRPKDL